MTKIYLGNEMWEINFPFSNKNIILTENEIREFFDELITDFQLQEVLGEERLNAILIEKSFDEDKEEE